MITRMARRPRKPVDEPTHVISIRNANWMTLSACRDVSTNIFFTDLDELPDPTAVTLCKRCPVREECLQWALEYDEEGYWGGTTRTQREAIMSGRHRVKCPGCGGRDILVYPVVDETICLSCGLSW